MYKSEWSSIIRRFIFAQGSSAGDTSTARREKTSVELIKDPSQVESISCPIEIWHSLTFHLSRVILSTFDEVILFLFNETQKGERRQID